MPRPTPHQLTQYTVLLLAAFVTALPLVLYGPSCGHDLTFHLVNWLDAAHQWRSGTLRPWWCFPAAWHTGEARFLFYPPLSWMLGALLTLLVGLPHAPFAYTFLCLAAAGITMRRFLLRYVGPPLALVGACLYLAHPYLLFTATERTAYAELLATAWLPWLLRESLRDRIAARRLAIPVALLWLTNTPSAVLATYALAVILALRMALAFRRNQPVLKPLLLPASLAFLWGIALSAFYLLPAVVQHGAVEVSQAFSRGMRPEDGTLFSHTGEPLHDQVVHQASTLAVLLLGIAAAAFVVLALQRHSAKRLHSMRGFTLDQARLARTEVMPVLTTLTAVTAFLLTPWSLPLWHHLPELHFLQFPWRTLMLQGLVTVAAIVLAVRTPLRNSVAIPLALAAVALISFTAHHLYAQTCDDEDIPSAVLAEYNSGGGFEPYDEYTPRDADNDLIHADEPPAWTAATAGAPPPQAESPQQAQNAISTGQNTVTLHIKPRPGDRFVIVRQRRFRNWHLSLDGKAAPQPEDRDDDLVALPLPNTEPHTLTLHYTWSPDEIAGLVLSLVAAAALLIPHTRQQSWRPAKPAS